MKTVAAAMGADVSGSSDSSDEPISNEINIDESPKLVSKDETSKNESMNYGVGEIKLGSVTVFGYERVDNID